MPLMIDSPAFPPGGPIPKEYTCDGADLSPPLEWSGAPQGVRSLVLVMEDPDAPGRVFRHWAAFDIPPAMTGLKAGYGRNRPATEFREARNDFGRVGYAGPCPPHGHGTHHYHIRLLALSQPRLDLQPGVTAAAVLQAAQPYVMAQAETVGTYAR